jgi:flagella basal body P-ring formation protein FlgA
VKKHLKPACPLPTAPGRARSKDSFRAVTLVTSLLLGALHAQAQAQAQVQLQVHAQTQTQTQTPVLAAPGSADSQLPATTVAQGLSLMTEAALAVAPRQARVEVEAGRLDPRLQLAPCARAEAYMPQGMPAWGHLRLGVRCTDGRVKWNVFLPVNVQIYAQAMVVTSALPAGAALGIEHLRSLEVDWSAANAPLFEQAEPLLGRTLARALSAGQPVQSAYLAPRQWFSAGDTVRIVAAGAGFAIEAEGQALTPGHEGKPARIQTEGGRVVIGRPVGSRRVEVGL